MLDEDRAAWPSCIPQGSLPPESVNLFRDCVVKLMRCRSFFVLAAVVAGSALSAGRADAVMLGFQERFETDSGFFWAGGPGTGVLPSGGPAGTGDPFLQVVADASGPGGRLTTHNNGSDWVGNYLAAGVTGVAMDLKNFSAQPLTIRIAVKEGSGPTSPGFSTSNAAAFQLPADGQWHRAVFQLTAAEMVQIGNPAGGLPGLLGGGMSEFRILHSTTPSLMGAVISATLGVDNITAIPVPGTAAVCGLGFLVLARRRRRAVP